MTSELKELEQMRGSKYIPAEKKTGENGLLIYESVLKKLVQGEQVLFIGLPCESGWIEEMASKQECQ